MVRGRGCNESFRAAIDKSYDGPEDMAQDGLSDKSSLSGQEAQNYESIIPMNPELEGTEGKAKKHKKAKDKLKIKEKNKKVNPKSKPKEKDKKEEAEDAERKTKKKSLGAMLRWCHHEKGPCYASSRSVVEEQDNSKALPDAIKGKGHNKGVCIV
ncbi:UNVERIFIED_CONTAM: hypothetical protein K2H54_047659 [Gekko kuhli]